MDQPPPKPPGLRHSLFGAAYLSIQPIMLNALSVPAMAYIIRQLGAANYGQWMTATALIGAVGFISALGLRGRFVRAVAKDPSCAPQALADQLGIRLLLTLIAMAVAVIVCVCLSYSTVVIVCTIVAGTGMFFCTVWTTLVDLLQAMEQFATMASVNMAAGLVVTGASVLAVAFGGGPIVLSLAYLLGPFTTMALLWMVVRKRHCPVRVHLSVKRSMGLIWECRQFTAQQMLTMAETSAAALMLPKLIGASDFGIFSAGSLLADRLGIVPDTVGSTLYPMVSRLAGPNPRQAARRTWAGMGLGLLCCLGMAVVATLLAWPIARILMPKAAEGCWQVIMITVWVLPLSAVQCAMNYTLLAMGKEAMVTRASAAFTVVSLLVGVFLIAAWGALGACWFLLARVAIRICFLLPGFLRTFIPLARSAAYESEGAAA